MPKIELIKLQRDFDGSPKVKALQEVSLLIEQGDFVAIEGPSGGGKSTLLNMIGLLDEPSGGAYLLDGRETVALTDRELSELRSSYFAFVFQNFHLLDRRPVLDSVELALLYRGVPPLERTRRAVDALRSVGLEHLLYQTANKLSGGERQRAAIARALASGAPILVADEPTGNLDSENSHSVIQTLALLHNTGVTVILVTHSPEIASVAPRSIKIRDGKIVADVRSSEPRLRVPHAWQNPPGRASQPRGRDIILDGTKSLLSRLGRTAGLVAAVAVGVALAVATLGISVSAGAQVSSTFDEHANRDVTISWHAADISDQPTTAQANVLARLNNLPGMSSSGLLEDRGQYPVTLGPAHQALLPDVYTITGNTLEAGRTTIRWADGHPHTLRTGEVLLGTSLAAKLLVGPLAGSPMLQMNGNTLSIAGIIDESPRNPELLAALLLNTTTPAGLGPIDSVKALLLTRSGAAQQVASQAPLVVNPYNPNSVVVDAPTDATKVRQQIESAVQSTLIALTGVALLASIVGLTNAMMLSVVERKQEFGLRRALGARPRHIAGLMLTESTIIGAIGGLAGLVLGLAGILVTTLIRHWSPVFDLTLAPAAITGGICVGAIGGILASARASTIQPSEALRQ